MCSFSIELYLNRKQRVLWDLADLVITLFPPLSPGANLMLDFSHFEGI